MASPKIGGPEHPQEPLFVLDAAAILEGANLPPSSCVTTPEVVAEVRSGGASGRRREQLEAGGMRVASADASMRARVESTARQAGNLGRLTSADVSVLALALGSGPHAVLWSADHTVLDVAKRLGVRTQVVSGSGIVRTLDWAARCAGCGRTYPVERAESACDVCGAQVRLKPAGAGSRPRQRRQ